MAPAARRSFAPDPSDSRATAADLALHRVEEGMAALRSVLAMGVAEEMSPEGLAVAEAHIVEAQRQLAAPQMSLRTRMRARADGNGPLPAVGVLAQPGMPAPRGRG